MADAFSLGRSSSMGIQARVSLTVVATFDLFDGDRVTLRIRASPPSIHGQNT